MSLSKGEAEEEKEEVKDFFGGEEERGACVSSGRTEFVHK